jgi:hypothetical protein
MVRQLPNYRSEHPVPRADRRLLAAAVNNDSAECLGYGRT